MDTLSLKLPLVVTCLVLVLLALVDLAAAPDPVVFASFAPALLWALILSRRGQK